MREETKWSIRCGCHTYVTLCYNGKDLRCFDNDFYDSNEKNDSYYMEHVISQIERRTGLKITEIPIDGNIRDFDGLRFLNGGFKKGCEWLTIPEDEK